MKKQASKGGKARARRLPARTRSLIARNAALVRWAKEGKRVPLAKYGTPDRPLQIGPIQITCYVLEDGTRVLAQRGLQSGIGLSEGGGKGGARKLAALLTRLQEKGLDVRGLIARANSPIRFVPPRGGNLADGYEATILPDICAVMIEAGQRGLLGRRLEHLAERCAILQHGFATVGIIALVDEATGYQEIRARDALAKILEKFVVKELQQWVRTFPPVFYEQIFRLNGWDYLQGRGNPGVVGHWTNNIVYKRLAPGVLDELRRLTPRDDKGRLKHRLFQHLTDAFGHPKLREHLAGVIMLMKYSTDWREFMERLDEEYPQWGDTTLRPYPEGYDSAEGADQDEENKT